MIRYGTGKAGQYAKTEARRRFDRLLKILITISCVSGVLIGIAMGVTIYPIFLALWKPHISDGTTAVLGIVLEVIALVVIFRLLRLFDEPIDKLSRERIRYLRGGQTEALVAYCLESLDDRWHLFNNVKMKGSGDIDHVLIGPGELFCISTKGNRGIYRRLADGEVTLNDRVNNDVKEAQRLAITLRHWLEARPQPDDSVKKIPWVQPVLVAPYAYVDFPSKTMNVWVMDADKLSDEALNAKAKLSAAEIRGCITVLKNLSRQDETSSSPAMPLPHRGD